MERDYVYSLICELAEQAGLDVRDYADMLYAEQGRDLDENLPAEVLEELREARRAKRELKNEQGENERVKQDIALFCELFPNTDSGSIPNEVWEEVSKGIPLTHAFAVFQRRKELLGIIAEKSNEKAKKTAPMGINEGDGESFFSSGEVEEMTPADIKKNYRNILLSIKKWK